MKNIRLLTDPESVWVAFMSNPGNESLRQALIEHYLVWVAQVARQTAAALHNRHEDTELLSCGVIGLHKAVSRYQLEYGIPFEQFAYKYVRSAMFEALRESDPLSRRQRRMFKQICQTSVELAHALGRDPRVEEIAGALSLSIAETEIYIGMGAQTVDILSERCETLSSSAPSPEEETNRKLASETLLEAIGTLSAHEQHIVRSRQEERPVEAIARDLHLSKGRVTQLYQNAVLKLRKSVGGFQ